eukprot:TRINITY_DN19511_c0_g1_i1.p1 TRINITY_DN19511_c0_g1~~TRINITY_DN19511_c0_g1_i1.p1  ORF type:complete len:941 (+),score=113.03 TRINITY_DN19511_c0_g1_i1:57-2825(+)
MVNPVRPIHTPCLDDRRAAHRSSLEALSATYKINRGLCDHVTEWDIEDLFHYLDPTGSQSITLAELARYFKEVLVPPCTDEDAELLVHYVSKNETGNISLQELSVAFMARPFRQLLSRSRKNSVEEADTHGVDVVVDRDAFLSKLKWRVNRDDSFNTLPFSAVSLFVFIGLVLVHLDVTRRQQVSAGLEAWIKGYGSDLHGPYLLDHVADAGTAWTWLSGSGLLSVLNECAETGDLGERCYVGPRHILIGGVYLNRNSDDGADQSEWLLHSENARTHLAAHPGDYLGAARARLQILQEKGWGNMSVDALRLGFVTFAERMHMFCVTEISVMLDSYGNVIPFVVSSTVPVYPYPNKATFLLDGAYVFLLLWMCIQESRDLIGTILSMGFLDGLHMYVQVWNLIDWLSFFFGVANGAIWVSCCLSMSTPAINALLVTSTGTKRMSTIIPHVMDLDVAASTAIVRDLNKTIGLFYALHIVMAFNTISIMLKFFKAFRANPRLGVFTDTLRRASVDIFHFSVIFSAVYAGFALVGHILFGGDLVEFCSFEASLNTGFVVLMGEFGWYSQASLSMKPLGSGIPNVALVAWFVFYMVFVLLILLNMLLAIVLEHYGAIMRTLHDSPEAVPLWTQCWGYVQQRKQTKGFIPFAEVLQHMEDPSEPGHPDACVTQGSLLNAFPKMQPPQAAFLIDSVVEGVKYETEDDEYLTRLQDIVGHVEAVVNELNRVGSDVEDGSIFVSTQQTRQMNMSRQVSPTADPLAASLSPKQSPLLSPEHQLHLPADFPQAPEVSSPRATLFASPRTRTTCHSPASSINGTSRGNTETVAAHPAAPGGVSLPAHVAKQLAQLATLPALVQELKGRSSYLLDKVTALCARMEALSVRIKSLTLVQAAAEFASSQRPGPKGPRELPSLCGTAHVRVGLNSASS